MRKTASIFLALALLLVVTGCKAQGENQADVPKETVAVEETQQAETTEQVETTETAEQAEPLSITDQDNSSLGEIGIELEKINLTDDQLVMYFESVYQLFQINSDATTLEGKIQEELEMLEYFFEVDATAVPPDDYAERYRAWRPIDDTTSTNNNNQSNPATSTIQGVENNSPYDYEVTDGLSDAELYYNGFSTYEEYINDLHRQFPDYTIEQIIEAFPDMATIGVNEAIIEQGKKDGLLTGHN